MIYIYACLLLHSAKKEINEDNLRKVVEAAGIEPDEAMIKSVVASVRQVNLEEILKSALSVPVTTASVQAAPAAPEVEKKEEKKEEVKEEEEKKEEEAFEGLASLFG